LKCPRNFARWFARSQVAYDAFLAQPLIDGRQSTTKSFFVVFASIELFPSDFFPNNGEARKSKVEGAPYLNAC